MRHRTSLRERGDTIIEVLVAITIVSMILGGAYVTSHNSLIATRDAQEHANALQLAQGQVELLRTLATSSSWIFTQSPPFCIATNGTQGASCMVTTSGVHSPTTSLDIYDVAIVARSAPNANGAYTFTIESQWPGLQNQNDAVQLLYRVYK
jgi:prepilin-type N-terminal cleavage/methylation domain-containing protein